MTESERYQVEQFLQSVFELIQESWNRINSNSYEKYGDPSYLEESALFYYFHSSFLEAYLDLYKKIEENNQNPMSQFALRTLMEMGFQKTNVYFFKNKSRREKAILLATLLDILHGDKDFKEAIGKAAPLFNEKSDLLQEDYRRNIEETLQSEDRDAFDKNLKTLSTNLYNLTGQIERKVPRYHDLEKLLRQSTLFNKLSHALHGPSGLMLKGILLDTYPYGVYLKTKGFQFQTSLNVLYRTTEFINDSELINKRENLTSEISDIAAIISRNLTQRDRT